MSSVEAAVLTLAQNARLSPKLAAVLLLALLVKDGHALVRLEVPKGTEERMVAEAVFLLSREVMAILARLYDRETLICPTLDASLEGAIVSNASLEAQCSYLQQQDRAVQSDAPDHLPQALVLPRLDRAARSAQIRLLEATRDGKVSRRRKSDDRNEEGEDLPVPDDFLFVAVVATDAEYGGLFRHLADRVALSCTFTLTEVGHLSGGVTETFRAVPLEPLLPPLPALHHTLRTYCSDLLTALRLHNKAPNSLLTARVQRFLSELVARRAALAGHEASPNDARYLLEGVCSHRLPPSSGLAAIEEVIAVV